MLDKLFQIIVKYRNHWYNTHYDKLVKSKIPVISVGNLSTGGTGKTPFIIELCKILESINCTPLIIGRGYKKKYKKDAVALALTTANVDYIGDEMINILEKTKAHTIVGKSKSNIVSQLNNLEYNLAKIEHDKNGIINWKKYNQNQNQKIIPNCIIIDDGFQHRKLQRDIDIVLIDETTLNKPYLIPKGRLREPISSLKRANIIILTKNAKKIDLLKLFPTEKPILEIKFNIDKPYILTNKNNSTYTINNEIIQPENMIFCCGIAKPKVFENMLTQNNINPKYKIIYDDHHKYNQQDINYICSKCIEYNCYTIATTEKDATKLAQFITTFNKYNIKVFIYPLKLENQAATNYLTKIIKNLLNIH